MITDCDKSFGYGLGTKAEGFNSFGPIGYIDDEPKEEEKKIDLFNKGWICPVCGAGLSPWTSKCNCNDIKDKEK